MIALAANPAGLLTKLVGEHHAITHHTSLADVVIACACTPAVQRDAAEWARHLLAVIGGFDITQTPSEEADACRVIPFTRK